jgi:hypothetical protein
MPGGGFVERRKDPERRIRIWPVAHDDGRLAAREKRARAEIGDLTCLLSNVIGDILLFEMRIDFGKDRVG